MSSPLNPSHSTQSFLNSQCYFRSVCLCVAKNPKMKSVRWYEIPNQGKALATTSDIWEPSWDPNGGEGIQVPATCTLSLPWARHVHVPFECWHNFFRYVPRSEITRLYGGSALCSLRSLPVLSSLVAVHSGLGEMKSQCNFNLLFLIYIRIFPCIWQLFVLLRGGICLIHVSIYWSKVFLSSLSISVPHTL